VQQRFEANVLLHGGHITASSGCSKANTSPSQVRIEQFTWHRRQSFARPALSSQTIGLYLHDALAKQAIRSVSEAPPMASPNTTHHGSTSPHDLFPDHLRQTQVIGQVGLYRARDKATWGRSKFVAVSLSVFYSPTTSFGYVYYGLFHCAGVYLDPLSASHALPYTPCLLNISYAASFIGFGVTKCIRYCFVTLSF
jgi:hypothetical protein